MKEVERKGGHTIAGQVKWDTREDFCSLMAKMDEMNHRKQADEKRLDVLLRAILGKKKPKRWS